MSIVFLETNRRNTGEEDGSSYPIQGKAYSCITVVKVEDSSRRFHTITTRKMLIPDKYNPDHLRSTPYSFSISRI